MIKNGLYASHQGKDYELIVDGSLDKKQYKLRSFDSADIANGFELYRPKDYPEFIEVFGKKYKTAPKNVQPTYYKFILGSDVDSVYFINTYGIYKGHEFPVEGETESTYWLRADQWSDWVAKLEFIRHDRDDITKEVPKSEVDPVYERKTPLPDFFNR